MPNPKRSQPTLFHRCVVKPLLEVLHVGCSPRRLAWSVAVGLIIGVNPLLGTTTLLALAAAALFRLNLVASQLATHLVYPVEIALFFVFVRSGNRIFHTGYLPLRHDEIFSALRHHPVDTTRLLWTWEWHALVVWAVAAIVFTPLLAAILTPIFERMHLEAPMPVLVKA